MAYLRSRGGEGGPHGVVQLDVLDWPAVYLGWICLQAIANINRQHKLPCHSHSWCAHLLKRPGQAKGLKVSTVLIEGILDAPAFSQASIPHIHSQTLRHDCNVHPALHPAPPVLPLILPVVRTKLLITTTQCAVTGAMYAEMQGSMPPQAPHSTGCDVGRKTQGAMHPTYLGRVVWI